jgi:hypothetical protein
LKTKIIKIFAIATLMIFLGAGVSLADDRKGDNGKRGHSYSHKDRGKDHDRKGYDRDDYRHYHGYREKSRHDYYKHEHFHRYKYNGHWNSWDSWEYYKIKNPHYSRYGRYETYNNQLFFMFDDGVSAFMFSIGR